MRNIINSHELTIRNKTSAINALDSKNAKLRQLVDDKDARLTRLETELARLQRTHDEAIANHDRATKTAEATAVELRASLTEREAQQQAVTADLETCRA